MASIAIHLASVAVIVLSAALSPFGLPAPAWAVHRADDDPELRLQLVLNKLHVYDDTDLFGSGEVTLFVTVQSCDPTKPVGVHLCESREVLANSMLHFSASSGSDVPLNVIVGTYQPEFQAWQKHDPNDASFGVFPDEHYELSIVALEEDKHMTSDDYANVQQSLFDLKPDQLPDGWEYMGSAAMLFDQGRSYAVGPNSLLASKNYGAYFSIDFEVRSIQLPDLVPHHLILKRLDDGRYDLCASVLNRGEVGAGQSLMLVNLEYPEYRLLDAFNVPSLGASQTQEYCFDFTGSQFEAIQPGALYQATVVVDSEGQVAERNEANNDHRFTIALGDSPIGQSQAGATGQATAPTGSEKPDLAVSAIRVKGSNPSGNNDCDPGNNQADVVVKNQGNAPAGGFLVRLTVDTGSDPPRVASLPGLAPGAEQTAGMGIVNLQKGQHALTASVDAKNQVAESDEDDNKKAVNVTCQDEGD
jgi:hypothetical protein